MFRVAQAQPDVRAEFIRKTYMHLAGAIGVFIALEAALLQTPLAEYMLKFIEASRFGWLGILGGFILVGWLGRSMAANFSSVSMQYMGLGVFVVAEAIIFVPLLYIAQRFSDPSVIPNAAIITLGLFAGLTAVAFMTRKDFSFLRGILTIGGFVALGLIVCSAIFGFGLGLLFSVVMVALACAAILYDTSKIIHHYAPGQHVAASLELFASIALLFWYVLRILMSLSRD
ncbi:Bax inhibitor-1 family protein [Planctomycetota bacterium]